MDIEIFFVAKEKRSSPHFCGFFLSRDMSGWCVCGVCERELYNIKISDECIFASGSKAERKFIHSSALTY